MTVLLTYEGYVLKERENGGFLSNINGQIVTFDSAAQWVQYIKYIRGYATK